MKSCLSVCVWSQNEYLGLVDQCMVFACELMDLCRGTQEVEAVLSEGAENGSPDPLARLKMAMEYEEKKVNYHDYVIGQDVTMFCSRGRRGVCCTYTGLKCQRYN